MTKLQDLVNEMLITREDKCMGDVWHNRALTEAFDDVKSNKFNQDIAKFVLSFIKHDNKIEWYDRYLTKTQLRKLNAIMKAKTKATLQKRVISFSNLITSGIYSSSLNRGLIEKWVAFCNEHNLKHGLVKVNRVKQTQETLNRMLQNM